MGLLERGEAALNARQQSAGATAATLLYQRKVGGDAINLTGLMWRGQTPVFRHPLQEGGQVVFSERDYLVPVADLAIDGVPFEPERGDRILEVLAGVTTVFEVLPPFGDDVARHSDPGRTRWRIHTKQVGA